MSTVKKRVAIYSNLPSGGARELYTANHRYFSKKFKIEELSDSNIIPRNFLDYIRICIFSLPNVHKTMAKQISGNSQVLIAYHSWLTKSPYILRYFSKPKIYICQEVMREYYDESHISSQSLREKIINFLRLPLKYIDKVNLESKNLTVIVNSSFSKKLVDKFYSLSSLVVYPGIDHHNFLNKIKIHKENQVISVGSINKLKRFEFLIKVISNIPKKYRPSLVLIGNGVNKKYESSLRKLANDREVNIKIIINADREVLISEYLKSRIFMYSPISEPFGIVVLEAMASGLPLIVYGSGGGYAEVINEKNGVIINNLDEHKWSLEVRRLLKSKNKQQEYEKYNKDYVKHNYGINQMNSKILQIINNI